MTTRVTIQQLYTDIVADLVPYYMDAVLLPNKQIITHSLSVEGQSGGLVRFPIDGAYTSAANVGEGASIIATPDSFTPTNVDVAFQKRGVGVNVTAESLEDGGFEMVRNATLTRLAGGLAEASDTAGLLVGKAGFSTHTDTGGGGANAAFINNYVMSPEALGYAAKREPSIAQWYNPNLDLTEFRATVRNGFAVLKPEYGQKITSRLAIGDAAETANVEAIAKGVANLRSENAPTGIDGAYVGIICPAMEFAINQQIAGVGGSTIGSLSDIGNNALRNALVDLVAGVRLYRSNSLPNAA
jgi:hypothetical protein